MREMDHRSVRAQSTVLAAAGRSTTGNVTTFLQALYRAVLHRPATRAELAAGMRAIGAEGRGEMVAELFHSNDALGRVIYPLYANLLGRAARAEEVVGGVACLRCGDSLDRIIAGMVAGEEYADGAAERHPEVERAAAMVVAAYNDLLQRMPGDGEVAAGAARVASGDRFGFVLSLLRSVEYRANFIEDLYQQLMHRSAMPPEIHPWTQRGHQALDLQRARLNLLASDAFFERWS